MFLITYPPPREEEDELSRDEGSRLGLHVMIGLAGKSKPSSQPNFDNAVFAKPKAP